MGGLDRRGVGADHDGLIRAAGGGGFVVGVAGVAGDPVVGAGLGGARACGGHVVAVAGHVGGDVVGDLAGSGHRGVFVVVELPADFAARVRAEQARQGGLVLDGRADDGGGRFLGGFDRRRGGADHDRLIRAAGGDGFVVGVAGVAGDPVVGAGLGGARACGGHVVAVAGHVGGAVFGGQAAARSRADRVVAELAAGFA